MSEFGDKSRPKVVVVSTTASAPLAAPEIVEESQKFIREIRQQLGVPNDGFYGRHLYEGVNALGIKPVGIAFLGALSHWNLVMYTEGGETSRVFDPQVGLQEIRTSLITSVYLTDIAGNQRRTEDPRELFRTNYEIPEYRLQGIGRVQIEPADCGPLCLWAAKRALTT